MVSVGVDIVEVERIHRAIEQFGSAFLDKIFTPGEIAYCRGKAREASSFAVRFAAKEAFAKALKVGKASVWREVEIVRGEEAPRPVMVSTAPPARWSAPAASTSPSPTRPPTRWRR